MSDYEDHAGRRLARIWLHGTVVALAIAAGALLLNRAAGPDRDATDLGAVAAEPDIHVETAVLRQFGADGALQYALTSAEIRYFQRDGLATLAAPDLVLYDRDRHAWQIRAATGTLHGPSVSGAGAELVRLEDDVVLQPVERRERLRLTTSSLTLYPDRQYAETDQAVIIDGEFGRTAAAGLEGDLQGGLLKLFSSAERPVQTVLLPGQFK
ncbi:MAG: LPS export ABC transporter periplasmic protein LptC [Pseudomonadales bacterium]|nr:LPS export ABC transporter periplasmic protein LptC [Pseudomonadales bacterium]